jgi:hypothetical protein
LLFNFKFAQNKNLEAVSRTISSNDWVTIVFLLILLLLAFSKKIYSEDFFDFSRIFISNKYFTSHKRTISVLNLFSFILFIGQSLIISLGVYYLINFSNLILIKTEGYLLFIQIFVAYNILIGVKYLTEKIIGEVFNISTFLDNYVFYKITYKNFLAILVLPILFIFTYGGVNTPIFGYLFLAVWAVANILVLSKYYSKNQKLVFGNWFYFILYLCTLEIAPYFILYKVVTGV